MRSRFVKATIFKALFSTTSNKETSSRSTSLLQRSLQHGAPKIWVGRFLSLCVILTSVGQTWAETGIPKDMVYISHGSFTMGIEKIESPRPMRELSAYDKRMAAPWSAEAFHDEGPAHTVLLDAYLIDKYEVSNHFYGAFMRATGHAAPAYWDDARLNRPEQPVVGVNWYDAKAFCEFHEKRLPTEAEWEKASRGPHANLYPWGNEFDPQKANFGKRRESTAPIDAYAEGVSHYGVYNMAGNVFEWVADWYDPRYYRRSQATANPTGPENPVWLGGTGTYVDRLTVGEKRVIRGGSWIAPEATLRTTHRFWNNPLNNSYGVGLGFRCARTAPPEIELQIREAYTIALVEMGREHFAEAQEAVARGLAIDPKNADFLELQSLIEQAKKALNGSYP